jgi:hypothetical protein
MIGINLFDKDATTRPGADEYDSGILKHPEGFADDRTAYPEGLTELLLGRQAISGIVLTLEDSVLQSFGNDLKKTPVLDRNKMILRERHLTPHGARGREILEMSYLIIFIMSSLILEISEKGQKPLITTII